MAPFLKILHRVNDLQMLEKIPTNFGIEIDLHAYGKRLVVHHNVFTDSVDFSQWLEAYNHELVILNIKEEGIESRVLDQITARGIENFFMLDVSFPAIVKLVRSGEKRIAVRVSKYESVTSAMTLAGKIDWIWLDVFDGIPINKNDFNQLKTAGFKICLVSPELQGCDPSEIHSFKTTIKKLELSLDAVCTKYPEFW